MSKLYAKAILKEWRENKGYTQQEMVALFSISLGLSSPLSTELDKDLSMSTYQKWEQGTLNLTPDNALELSRFTRIALQDLVERK